MRIPHSRRLVIQSFVRSCRRRTPRLPDRAVEGLGADGTQNATPRVLGKGVQNSRPERGSASVLPASFFFLPLLVRRGRGRETVGRSDLNAPITTSTRATGAGRARPMFSGKRVDQGGDRGPSVFLFLPLIHAESRLPRQLLRRGLDGRWWPLPRVHLRYVRRADSTHGSEALPCPQRQGKKLRCGRFQCHVVLDVQNLKMPGLRVLVPTQNQINNDGECRDCFMLDPETASPGMQLPNFAPPAPVDPSAPLSVFFLCSLFCLFHKGHLV